MSVITVSSKGQIAIPKEFRDKLRIGQGTKLSLRAEGQELILRKAFGSDWRQMRGAFKGPSLTAARRQERREELKREAKNR